MAHNKLSINDRLKSEYKHWASHCLGIKVLIQNAFYSKVIIKVKISIIYIPGETEVWYIFVTIKSELTCSMLTFWFLFLLEQNYTFSPCIIEFRLRNINKWSDSLDLTKILLSYQCFITPHSSTLAWKISWTEEPGRLQSMGWWRVGHDWVTSLWLFIFMRWRRKWQPTPVFLPGESQRWGSPVGCHLWCRTESDTTEVT